MSHLSLPRVHFQGEFVTNVATANNDDVVDFVDVATARVDTKGQSDTDFRQWLKETQDGRIRAGWNYFGDNTCRFRQVTVTRIDLPDKVITSETDDPLIGATVLLDQAVMVDLDPEGFLGTQIFCDRFGVRKGNDLFWEGPTTRFYSRWLVFQRNLGVRGFTGASAVWQAAILRDQLAFQATTSPTVEALRVAAESEDGLVVRFCTYLVAPEIEPADLARRFKEGLEPQNPAMGRVLGTIGLHQAQELASVTLGRMLHPAARHVVDRMELPLGPAVAQIDRERRVVSLDLITAFPERDETLEKVTLGPVSLRLLCQDDNNTTEFTLGPVPYDRTAYEASAGIVDIPYSQDVEPFLDKGRFLLWRDGSGAPLLSETDLAIETDDRALYLQPGETQQVHIKVMEKGHAPQKEVTMRLEQFVTTNKQAPHTPASSDAHIVEMPDLIRAESDGTATLTLKAKRPGVCVIRFVPAEDTPSRFEPSKDSFTNVRVLPEDDYDHVPDEQLTFEFIYREVLQYYHLVYPAMSRRQRIDFSNEKAVRASAIGFEERASKALWHSSAYMPRTRELSDGKLKLLHRWFQL